MERLLLIDDDRELTELLVAYLAREGFDVSAANDSEEGLSRALAAECDLVVLDVMMPKLNGVELLRRIRSSSRLPVIMLTARGEEVDRIVGLEVGADDYLPKPFNARELVARIRAILRRSAPDAAAPRPSPRLAVGDVLLDAGTRAVTRAGKPVELTSVEFAVLEVLLAEAGRVVGREALAERAMGKRHTAYDRSVDVHISNLRRKLGPAPDRSERIVTVRNAGYQYALPVEPSARPGPRPKGGRA